MIRANLSGNSDSAAHSPRKEEKKKNPGVIQHVETKSDEISEKTIHDADFNIPILAQSSSTAANGRWTGPVVTSSKNYAVRNASGAGTTTTTTTATIEPPPQNQQQYNSQYPVDGSEHEDNHKKASCSDAISTSTATIEHTGGNNHSNDNTVASVDDDDDRNRNRCSSLSVMDDDSDASPVEETLQEQQPQNEDDDDDDGTSSSTEEEKKPDRWYFKDILEDFSPEELDDFIKHYQDHAKETFDGFDKYSPPAYNHQDLMSFRDILDDFPKDERKAFITFCRKNVHHYSNNISFIDGAVVIAILIKSGIVNRHADNKDFDLLDFGVDTNVDGRVTELVIDPYELNRYNSNGETERNVLECATFGFPRDIVHLRFLEDLVITDLRSISQNFDFSMLPNLTNLRLLECRGFDAPLHTMIPQLKYLRFDFKMGQTPFRIDVPFNHFPWMTSVFPNLECLDIRDISYSGGGSVSDSFCDSDSDTQPDDCEMAMIRAFVQNLPSYTNSDDGSNSILTNSDGGWPLLPFDGYINDDVCFRDSLKKFIITPRTAEDFGEPDNTIAEIFCLVLPKLVNKFENGHYRYTRN